MLTYGLDLCSLNKHHHKSIETWYFRHLRIALPIKTSYYSRIFFHRLWKAAGKPPLPTQLLLGQQNHTDPLHPVVFSPGYKDRIKFTKSTSRGHPARYWYELVIQDALRAYHQDLDHHAIVDDFLGLKQRLNSDPKFGEYLMTAPTCTPHCFPLYRMTVGSAWQA